jgi:hypothetical protein
LPACPRCLVPSQLVHSPSATAGAWSSSSRTPVSPAPKGRDKRPGLDRPLKAVARRDVDMVAAWSVDRLGRSLIDLLDFLRELHAPSELAFGLHGNSKHYPPFGGSTGEGRPS